MWEMTGRAMLLPLLPQDALSETFLKASSVSLWCFSSVKRIFDIGYLLFLANISSNRMIFFNQNSHKRILGLNVYANKGVTISSSPEAKRFI